MKTAGCLLHQKEAVMKTETNIIAESMNDLKELVEALEDQVMLSVSFEEPETEEEDDGWTQ